MGKDGARRWSIRRWDLGMPLVVAALAASSVACGAHGGAAQAHVPTAAPPTTAAAGAQARDETRTVSVDYAFDRDSVAKDFDKTFDDGFVKKGLRIDETLTAHARFDVKDAKITGTVTYVKRSTGEYAILEADLVASGHYEADVQVDIDVHAKGDARKAAGAEWEKTLLAGRPVPIVKNMMPANIPIAGPLSLHAHFDLSASCEMQVEGPMHATTGVGISGDVRLAAKYKRDGADGPDGKKPSLQLDAKAPGLELAPKPYLKVDGKQQHMTGHCSLRPVAVLDIDPSFVAKVSVEPYVDIDAKRSSARDKWTLDAQAGINVSAATDLELFGERAHERKQSEYALFDTKLTKPGDEMGAPPRAVGPAVSPRVSRAAKVEVASVLDAGLGTTSQPAPRAPRGAFGKKKKL
jgi:hypothetical protein